MVLEDSDATVPLIVLSEGSRWYLTGPKGLFKSHGADATQSILGGDTTHTDIRIDTNIRE